MAAILEISDGTTTVNLIKSKEEYGYHLVSWRPNVPFYKGGGTFQESSLAWGRHIIDKQFANPMDTFTLHANQTSQDILIRELQDLRRLLEKASYYYTTDWQNSRVWIKAKATNETNARYAVIITGTIAEDDNPFSQPFLQPGCYAVMGDLSIAIEHDFWTENAPGTGTATALASAQTYDGRNLGNVDAAQVIEPTTTDNVYYANKGNMANITDMYIDDGGVFSLNLMDVAVPFNLLPAVPTAADFLYIGVDTALANSGPFCSVVFDLSVAGSGYTANWEYYSSAGPGWAGLATLDDTTRLTVAGTNSVRWRQDVLSWIPFAVNGITAYWIRLNVATVPGPLQAPIQQNRLPYSIVWPYVEVQAAGVGGDVPAINKINIINQTGLLSGGAWCLMNRLKCSLRSVSRGEDFTPYINLADTQNHAGITITDLAGGLAFTTSMAAASGRYLYAAGTGVTADVELCRIDFGPTIVDHFYGTFHLYMRTSQGAQDWGEIALKVRAVAGISSETNYWHDTGWVDQFPASGLGPLFLSMGRITIPPGDILPAGQVWDRIRLSISMQSTITRPLALMELILFPVDEWSADIIPADENSPYPLMVTSDYFSIDSIDSPKVQPFVFSYDAAGQIIGAPHTRTVGPSILQSNARQRLYFFMTGGGVAGLASGSNSNTAAVGSVLLEKQQRYLSMRGDR